MSEFKEFGQSPAPDGTKPPRPTAGYADLLAARLRRLAAGRSTGVLPFSGDSDGVIYLRAGYVVGAESSRTPGLPAASPHPSSAQAGPLAAAAPQAGHLAAAAPQAGHLAAAAPQAGHLAAAAPQAGHLAAAAPPEVLAPDSAPTADSSANGRPANGSGAAPEAGPPEGHLLAPLLRVEPAIDAVLDLVLSQSAIGRFRTGKSRSGPELAGLPADSLIAEISRRLHLSRQMAALVTADTAVSRSPRLRAARVQVSALQWALLIRAGTATTPRALAWALGRSVFGTTSEVYQLVSLHLLLVADQVGSAPDLKQRDPLGPLEPCPGAVSFLRAVSEEKGDNGMPKLTDTLDHAGGGR
jgi:hypothetical protein